MFNKLKKRLKKDYNIIKSSAKAVGSFVKNTVKRVGGIAGKQTGNVVSTTPTNADNGPRTVTPIPGRFPGEQGFQITGKETKPGSNTAFAPGDLGGSSSPAQSMTLRTATTKPTRTSSSNIS